MKQMGNDDLAPLIGQGLCDPASFLVLSDAQISGRGMTALQTTWREGQAEFSPLVRELISRTVPFPWGEQAGSLLYAHLLEFLTLDEMHGVIQEAYQQAIGGKPTYLSPKSAEIFRTVVDSSLIVSLLEKLVDTSYDRRSFRTLFEAFLFEGCADRELRELDLPRNLVLEDRYTYLSSLWKCWQGLAPDTSVPAHRRLWFWLTNAERLLGYKPDEKLKVVRGLEWLMCAVPHYLTIWVSFEGASPKVLAMKIKDALGPILTRQIASDLTL